jgi:hypothetical protein
VRCKVRAHGSESHDAERPRYDISPIKPSANGALWSPDLETSIQLILGSGGSGAIGVSHRLNLLPYVTEQSRENIEKKQLCLGYPSVLAASLDSGIKSPLEVEQLRL